MSNLYKVLIGTPRHGWEEKFKIIVRGRCHEGVEWPVAGFYVHGNEPSGFI
jgi:hypothetical protein